MALSEAQPALLKNPQGKGPWAVALFINIHPKAKAQTEVVVTTDSMQMLMAYNGEEGRHIQHSGSSNAPGWWVCVIDIKWFVNWSEAITFFYRLYNKTRGRRSRIAKAMFLTAQFGNEHGLVFHYVSASRDELYEVIKKRQSVKSEHELALRAKEHARSIHSIYSGLPLSLNPERITCRAFILTSPSEYARKLAKRKAGCTDGNKKKQKMLTHNK